MTTPQFDESIHVREEMVAEANGPFPEVKHEKSPGDRSIAIRGVREDKRELRAATAQASRVAKLERQPH